ncbi:hypothetical protein PENTCL1PPCAC_30323, partial [Pristionchus entomophagus]
RRYHFSSFLSPKLNESRGKMADLVSPYMHWKDLAETIKPGDLIECRRCHSSSSGGGIYQHWAVYMGIVNGVHKVIHYSNDALNDSARRFGISIEISGNVEVQWATLEQVANGCAVRKNNSHDNKQEPRSPEEIIEMAKQKLGESEYNLVTNNCEHFANYCRYGRKRSGQVQTTAQASAGVFGIFAAVVVIGGVCAMLFSKSPQSSKQSTSKSVTNKPV